jgi:hypothetical protein
MINVREFIKQLGDKAPDFFSTKKETVARWLKTGNIPFKAVEKVLVADETLKQLQGGNQVRDIPEPQPEVATQEPDVDPLTHLPVNLPKNQPRVGGGRAVSAGGTAPDWIEADPTEQNFGVNMTRPGRINAQPLPPMKIRKENGQSIPYVEQPKPVTNLPPEIGGGDAGWSNRGEPIPQPKRENERPIAPKPTEGVSETKV